MNFPAVTQLHPTLLLNPYVLGGVGLLAIIVFFCAVTTGASLGLAFIGSVLIFSFPIAAAVEMRVLLPRDPGADWLESGTPAAAQHQAARWQPALDIQDVPRKVADRKRWKVLDSGVDAAGHGTLTALDRGGAVQNCTVWTDGPATWQGQRYIVTCNGHAITDRS